MSKFSFRKKNRNTSPANTVITNELIFDPYNIKNKLITKDEVQQILSQCEIEYDIHDISLFQTAFVDKTYSREYITSHLLKHKNLTLAENEDGAIPIQDASYDRLEFLGDAIIELAAVSYIFTRFSGQNEKLMHRVKTNIVDRYALARFTKHLGMDKYIILSKQAENKHKREDVKTLCDIFESFLGALYEDVNNRDEYRDIKFNSISNIGFQVCESLYITVVEEEVDFEDIVANDTNYKSKLIQYYQHNFQCTPTFKVLRKETDDDTVTMAVLDKMGDVFVTANGETEKQAEQNVARVALEKLKSGVITE